MARFLSLVLAVLTAGLVLVPTAPTARADPPFRLSDYVTDNANALIASPFVLPGFSSFTNVYSGCPL